MKWIKKYENFDVNIKDDIDDIFLELTDSDDKWNISLLNEYNYDSCNITHYGKNLEEDIDVMIDYLGDRGCRSTFKIEDDLLECIYRLIEYMESIGYSGNVWARSKTYERSVNLDINPIGNGGFSLLSRIIIEPNGRKIIVPIFETSVIQIKFKKSL